MLEATLDALIAAVDLVTCDGRVVYMNATAERLIKTGDALRVVGDRLLLTDLEARAALVRAIGEVASEEVEAPPARRLRFRASGAPAMWRRCCRSSASVGRTSSRSSPRRSRSSCSSPRGRC